ncbi:MAG: SRPBCC family protein [Alphaproteobacteria bacterium]|nr:SRPBCC family protein [Alphaproteobacteria bacterium]
MKAATAALALLAAAPASADIVTVASAGFSLSRVETVSASPDIVYAMLLRPSLWWSGGHTWSGDARNLTLEGKAGGCYCETLPGGGSVQHGVIVYAQPGRTLRLHAALGPLQGEGVNGALTWVLKPAPGGGTEIRQTYVVGGYIGGGAEGYAKPVDGVMTEQLTRLKAALDKTK